MKEAMLKPPATSPQMRSAELLASEVPAHVPWDAYGLPHVTPLWFVWGEGGVLGDEHR